MKRRVDCRWLQQVTLAVLALIAVAAGDCWAADAAQDGGFTRATWDYVMRWVNFAILAGVIIKYARSPLINFLKDKKAETAGELKRFEAQKKQAEQQIREGQLRLEASKERLDLIQKRIIDEGKMRKEKMISEAKEESRLMLAAARLRIDHQVQEVARTIRNEMIDAAYDMAVAKLPQQITEKDQKRLVDQWMSEAAQ